MRAPVFQAKAGSIQLPLLFALALMLAIGFKVGDGFREAVVARKAVYAADAAATAGLYLLQPMEYTPPGLDVPLTPLAQMDILSRTALVNGMFPELFAPMTLADIMAGPVSVSVTFRSLDPDMSPYSGDYHGIPSDRMGAGRVWTNELGLAIAATGVLPLGVQSVAMPVNNPFPVMLGLGDALAPASFIQWSLSDPLVVSHLLALGFIHGGPPLGVPPPGMSVEDMVIRLPPMQPAVDNLLALLIGRVVVLPVLTGDQVSGFARARILSLVTTPPYQIQIALAPSAAVRCALGPALPRDYPVPAASDIPQWGLVLRPWRTGA
jgi:hypothetical protein